MKKLSPTNVATIMADTCALCANSDAGTDAAKITIACASTHQGNGHTFCDKCLLVHIKECVNRRGPVRCPRFAECRYTLSPVEVKEVLLNRVRALSSCDQESKINEAREVGVQATANALCHQYKLQTSGSLLHTSVTRSLCSNPFYLHIFISVISTRSSGCYAVFSLSFRSNLAPASRTRSSPNVATAVALGSLCQRNISSQATVCPCPCA